MTLSQNKITIVNSQFFIRDDNEPKKRNRRKTGLNDEKVSIKSH